MTPITAHRRPTEVQAMQHDGTRATARALEAWLESADIVSVARLTAVASCTQEQARSVEAWMESGGGSTDALEWEVDAFLDDSPADAITIISKGLWVVNEDGEISVMGDDVFRDTFAVKRVGTCRCEQNRELAEHILSRQQAGDLPHIGPPPTRCPVHP